MQTHIFLEKILKKITIICSKNLIFLNLLPKIYYFMMYLVKWDNLQKLKKSCCIILLFAHNVCYAAK